MGCHQAKQSRFAYQVNTKELFSEDKTGKFQYSSDQKSPTSTNNDDSSPYKEEDNFIPQKKQLKNKIEEADKILTAQLCQVKRKYSHQGEIIRHKRISHIKEDYARYGDLDQCSNNSTENRLSQSKDNSKTTPQKQEKKDQFRKKQDRLTQDNEEFIQKYISLQKKYKQRVGQLIQRKIEEKEGTQQQQEAQQDFTENTVNDEFPVENINVLQKRHVRVSL